MAVNLVKICVGVDDIGQLAKWQDEQLNKLRSRDEPLYLRHITRHAPQRASEIVNGGSIYWIIKGFIRVRQLITNIEPIVGVDGVRRCALLMDKKLVRTHLQPRRAHQGWRYLSSEDAPDDLVDDSSADLPDELAEELRALGLL